MRLLALVTDAYGGSGGIARSTRDLLGALAAQLAVEHVDVLPRNAPQSPGVLPPKMIQRSPISSRARYAARAMAAAARRPNVVLCNHLYMAPLALAAARLAGARLLIQLHGIEIWRQPTAAQRRALKAADLVLCVSRDTRARAVACAEIDPERAIVVSNTVDPRFAVGDRTAARHKLGFGDQFVLLTTGRMDRHERYKGHDRMIAALPRLIAAQRRPLVWLIAGSGDDQTRLAAAVRAAGLDDHVRFLGQVADADLPDLYRAADLFCLPSTGEGFGIAFLEAMASGTPAVGLDCGGAPDALGDGLLGTMAAPEADLAEVLDRAIATPRPLAHDIAAEVTRRFGQAPYARRIEEACRLLEELPAC